MHPTQRFILRTGIESKSKDWQFLTHGSSWLALDQSLVRSPSTKKAYVLSLQSYTRIVSSVDTPPGVPALPRRLTIDGGVE